MANANNLNVDQAGIQTYTTTTGDLSGSATTQYNVLVGDTSNKIANVSPSATSGVPLVSGGSSANPSYTTAVVAGGGTGNTTFTAYSVICAGTSATGAFQNVSGVGTSGQVLKSNGSGALPSWQSVSGAGYTFQIQTNSGNPADATTYFMASGLAITSSTASAGVMQKLICPLAGTITACSGFFITTGVLGSNQNTSVIIRLNNTTDVTVTSTAQLTAILTSFSNTGLSQAVSAGDFLEFKVVCPTWATNPTTVSFTATILIS